MFKKQLTGDALNLTKYSIKTKKTADPYAVREIVLYIENDSHLYRSIYQPIVKAYAKRVIRKNYRRDLALKGVVNLIDAGLVKYRREMGLAGAREYGLGPGVSMATKQAAAKIILSGMVEEIRQEVQRLRALGVKR